MIQLSRILCVATFSRTALSQVIHNWELSPSHQSEVAAAVSATMASLFSKSAAQSESRAMASEIQSRLSAIRHPTTTTAPAGITTSPTTLDWNWTTVYVTASAQLSQGKPVTTLNEAQQAVCTSPADYNPYSMDYNGTLPNNEETAYRRQYNPECDKATLDSIKVTTCLCANADTRQIASYMEYEYRNHQSNKNYTVHYTCEPQKKHHHKGCWRQAMGTDKHKEGSICRDFSDGNTLCVSPFRKNDRTINFHGQTRHYASQYFHNIQPPKIEAEDSCKPVCANIAPGNWKVGVSDEKDVTEVVTWFPPKPIMWNPASTPSAITSASIAQRTN